MIHTYIYAHTRTHARTHAPTHARAHTHRGRRARRLAMGAFDKLRRRNNGGGGGEQAQISIYLSINLFAYLSVFLYQSEL